MDISNEMCNKKCISKMHFVANTFPAVFLMAISNGLSQIANSS